VQSEQKKELAVSASFASHFSLLLKINLTLDSLLRACETITPHFRLPSSGHLEPIFTRKILNVGFATPAVLLPQIGSI